MKTENAEKLGLLADKVDNLVHALQIPMPNNLHIKGLQESLPDVVTGLRSIYISETGECPWATDVQDMPQEQVNELSDEFLEGNRFDNFETFWEMFLSTDPGVLQMAELIKKLEGWAYYLNQ